MLLPESFYFYLPPPLPLISPFILLSFSSSSFFSSSLLECSCYLFLSLFLTYGVYPVSYLTVYLFLRISFFILFFLFCSFSSSISLCLPSSLPLIHHHLFFLSLFIFISYLISLIILLLLFFSFSIFLALFHSSIIYYSS